MLEGRESSLLGGGSGYGKDRKEGRGEIYYREKHNGTDGTALKQGALSSAGASWEVATPPLHSSLRSSLPAPTSRTEILISTADGEGNSFTRGGGMKGGSIRREEED